MEKEPGKGQVWDPLCPQLISHLVTPCLAISSGILVVLNISMGPGPHLPLLNRPFLSVTPWNQLVLLRSGCLFVTGLLSGVFPVPDIPLKRLSSSLRSLANGDLQPGEVIAKQGLVKCLAGVVVHLIGHFIVSSNEGNVIKVPVLLLCVGLEVWASPSVTLELLRACAGAGAGLVGEEQKGKFIFWLY